ncbi:MAG: hypothetical protein JO101_02285 [Candidatus Eremiobacteraeota bacterium]|nr:hypothetical protein [Candidatus Eremiobacteraeota bacterium]
MRTQPHMANDPKALNGAAKAFLACAGTQQASLAAPLMNQSLLGAASASLLAARQETGQKAIAGASLARDATAAILGYKRGPSHNGAGSIKNQNTPSMLSTNALRIYNSSNALIAKASGAQSTTATSQ